MKPCKTCRKWCFQVLLAHCCQWAIMSLLFLLLVPILSSSTVLSPLVWILFFRFFRSLMLCSYQTHSLTQSYFLVWLSSVRFIETLPLKTSSDSSVHSLLVSLVCLDWMFLFNLSFQFWWKYLSMSSSSRALLSMSDDEHINVKLI